MRWLTPIFILAVSIALGPSTGHAQTNAAATIRVAREVDLPVASEQERRYWALSVTRGDIHLALWSLPDKDKPWTIEVVNGFSMTNSVAAVAELETVLDKFEEWSDVAATNNIGAVTKVIKSTQTAFGSRDFRFVVAKDEPPRLSISDGPDLSEADVDAILDLLDEYPAAMEEWKAKAGVSERAAELFK